MNYRRVLAAAATVLTVAGLFDVASATAQPVRRAPAATGISRPSAAELAAIRRAAPRPPRVTNLAPYRDGSTVTLGWHDPNPALFRRVLVRYAPGDTAPASPRDGSAVQLSSRRATTATLADLRPNARYSAAVWTRDAHDRLSARTATTFITPARPRTGLATISGTVTDTSGAPLSGVVVTAQDWSLGTTETATVTGVDGSYRLVLPPAQYILLLDGSNGVGGADDSTGYMGDGRDLTLSARDHVTFNSALRAGAAMSGRVTDASGTPLAGVTVFASPSYPYVPADIGDESILYEFLDGQTTSGRDGSFMLKGLYPDVTQACFDPTTAGLITSGADGFGYDQQCADTPHSVHAGRVVNAGTTKLTVGPPGGSVHGTVSAPDGTGVPGVFVTASPVGRRFAVAYEQTGGDGSYSISGLKPGSYRICAQTSGLPVSDSQLGYVSRCRTRHVTVTSGETARARINVYPGGAFTGVVRAPDGTPVSGASVWLLIRNGAEALSMTDTQGRFAVGGLRSGRYRACIDATTVAVPGYPNGVSSGCYQHNARFVVRRGRIRIGIDFPVQPAAAIRGTVVNAAGDPQRRVDVETNYTGAGIGLGSDSYATTGRNGHFKITGLKPGRYQLCYSSEYLVGELRNGCPRRAVSVRRGELGNYGTIDVGRAGAIHATVSDASGQALNGVDVAALVPCHGFECDKSPLFGSRFRVAASWVTYGNGTVNLGDMKPGKYAVCLFGYLAAPRRGPTPPTGYTDRCLSQQFDVTVRGGRTTVVGSVLELAGEVTGTVTDEDGNPVPNVMVDVSGSAVDNDALSPFYGNSLAQYAMTGTDGTYAVRSVAAGDQTVCFDASAVKDRFGFRNQCYGGAPGRKTGTPVSVSGGSVTTGIDVTLRRLGKIAGAVTNTAGRPLSRRADVFIFRPGHPRSALVGSPAADGTYRTPGLPPGQYIVCFTASGYIAQCYDDVPWSGFNGKPLPADATRVNVSSAAVARGIDAVLARS